MAGEDAYLQKWLVFGLLDSSKGACRLICTGRRSEIVGRVPRRGIAVLAGHCDRRSVRAAGERQQHHRAGKIEADATLHARENASPFFINADSVGLR